MAGMAPQTIAIGLSLKSINIKIILINTEKPKINAVNVTYLKFLLDITVIMKTSFTVAVLQVQSRGSNLSSVLYFTLKPSSWLYLT